MSRRLYVTALLGCTVLFVRLYRPVSSHSLPQHLEKQNAKTSQADHDLLPLAQRLMPAGFDGRKGLVLPIGWLSEREFLYCYMRGYTSYNPYMVFDVQTGTSHTQEGLTQRLHDQYAVPYRLSPDRKWLLGGNSIEDYVTALDGSHALKWDARRESSSWKMDSSGLYTWDGTHQRLFSRSLTKPHIAKRVPIPSPSFSVYPIASLSDGWLMRDDVMAEFDTKRVLLVRFVVQGKKVALHQTTISIPHDGVVIGVTLSPQGDRLAWLIRYKWQEKDTSAPRERKGTPFAAGFWVSRLDGSEMQEIGHQKEASSPQIIGSWNWRPDGKELWFQYDHWIWRVSVS